MNGTKAVFLVGGSMAVLVAAILSFTTVRVENHVCGTVLSYNRPSDYGSEVTIGTETYPWGDQCDKQIRDHRLRAAGVALVGGVFLVAGLTYDERQGRRPPREPRRRGGPPPTP